MRSLLLFLLLFFTITTTRAQDDIQHEIDSVMNGLYSDTVFANELFTFDTTRAHINKKWNEIDDSITNLIVRKHVAEDVVIRDDYPYPGFALEIQYSPTYAYILQHKYKIRRPARHGCIIPYYQRKYDSLVADKLKSKFGVDVFERTFKEAEKLDKENKGLLLPYLKDSINILTQLKREIPNWDTMCSRMFSERPLEYLIITFEGNTVAHVDLAENFWGIQPLFGVEMPRGLLESVLNKLTWEAPLYNRKPIDKAVTLNLYTNEISWFNYWD
ncbi:hypothetical protein F0919_03755 [Taibaiella lutea]|uniref:DUF4294 domain-containing protein n=1 Tax=Taibaiella lutea TaxID=2608001 RepID=A0A5M6CNY1_9BACT|nr:hypothetical protein [Taibaiella lutea]KAA5536797.1 hypothetical protein F0919_03755 [Taibaiella lutea]